ncbi:glycosyltransferase family 87 protein [Microcoleus sp.]|uniref:glycosyltransferase family 87 protein n=1 Tax=Microcoleus sp. TaxID=44472 RepID=UPI00403ECF41
MKESFKRNFCYGLVALNTLSLILFGILGIGRGNSKLNFDGDVLYAAGRTWLRGLNAYNYDFLVQSTAGIKDFDSLEGADFFYPPQSAALCMFVGLFEHSVAKFIWLGLNLLSIAAIIFMTVRTLNQHQNNSENHLGSWIMAAMIIGNPFTSHVVWMGQTSLMAFAATMAAWFFSQRQKFVWAGICLGIASFKPQLCLLLGIWFLLEGNWKILAVAFATVTITSAYPLVLYGGPVGMLAAWHQGIQDGYSSLYFNQPGSLDIVGMESIFAFFGLKIPAIKIMAIILAVLLWVFRKRINREDVLGVLMGISFTFLGYSHVYDYVGLLPILTSLWLYCSNNRNALLSSIALVFLLFFPRRIFIAAGLPFLIHWRTIVVLILVVGVVALSMKAKSRQEFQQEIA